MPLNIWIFGLQSSSFTTISFGKLVAIHMGWTRDLCNFRYYYLIISATQYSPVPDLIPFILMPGTENQFTPPKEDWTLVNDGLRLQKKFWPGGLLIWYITCHRLPETINEALFFSQHLVSFVRFTEVVATVACEYFAKVSVTLLHNAGCICEAMSKMARFLITPGKC